MAKEKMLIIVINIIIYIHLIDKNTKIYQHFQ